MSDQIMIWYKLLGQIPGNIGVWYRIHALNQGYMALVVAVGKAEPHLPIWLSLWWPVPVA